MHAPVTDARQVQRIFIGIGVVALAASIYMAWQFGASISRAHGVALVTACVAAGLIFPARRLLNPGATGSAVLLTAGLFFVALEFMSHLGYTFGMRERQQVEASAQTNVHTVAFRQVDSEQTNLALWRDQLAKLQAENAWAATVNPDGLKAQLASAQKAIDLEAARGGCKAVCLARMKEKAALEERIAIAERASDLSRRIEATQRILDGKVNTASATKIGHSTVKAQQDSFAQLLLLASGTDAEQALQPGAVAKDLADKLIGFLMAVGATALPSIAFYIGFFGLPVSAPMPIPAPAPMPPVALVAAPSPPAPVVEPMPTVEAKAFEPAPTPEPAPSLAVEPINITVPVHISQDAEVRQQTPVRIVRVRDSAFARRVAAISAEHHARLAAAA